MENLGILSDFSVAALLPQYKKIADTFAGGYNLYSGGNFFYITGPDNKAVRFTLGDHAITDISEEQLINWLTFIRTRFPLF